MNSAARAAALWVGTCAVAVSGILPAAAVERGTGAPPAGLVAALERTVADGFPGAVAYARDGGQESRTAAGLADTTTGERARPDHRFRIAGNTTSFVSTVLLQLEGEGRLSLDDSVETWLPGVVRGHGNDGRAVALRQLLNHTSGIYDPTDEAEFFAPYLILTPLGLKDTPFSVTGPDIHGPHLHGYDLGGRDVTRFSPSYDWTAGVVISTVDDLARFHRALFTGRLLRPAQQRELLTTVQSGDEEAYGLGVRTVEVTCGSGPGAERISAWATDGGGPGFTSVSLTTADGERQLVLAFNVFDLGANLRKQRPVPYTEALGRAQAAALCD
ncbi:serine hydrolase domain-containing protein [Streptomyces erythrochromogenes]|uniref:serine hydrolase domain-containing protein n=1 Tax=Streptomyces erythrochromogenes TaxID=285574 RepID=UPI00380F2405